MKPTPKKQRNPTFGSILLHLMLALGTVVLVAVLYFYIYLPKLTNHGETITVPNIEGMKMGELENFLVNRNLRYAINDSSYSEKYPPLTVIKQYPAADTKVKEGRVIYISVNRINPPTLPMPNLVDGSLINAEAVLRGNELKRGKVESVPGPFLNLVKEMKYQGHPIKAGTRIPKGSVIDLVVEDGGSNELTMPDVLGLSLEDAKVSLLGSNLVIGHIKVMGDTSDIEPVVLKQIPIPNDNIQVGDVVELWVGKRDSNIDDQD